MRLRTWMAVLLTFVGVSPAWAGSIAVVVDRELPDYRIDAPVKFGVPFPEGAFKPGDAVQVVDDKGAVLPSQSAVLATWDPKGEKGVRWLLVDFSVNPERSYRVVYGEDLIGGKKPGDALAKVNEDKSISIETNTLSGTISGVTGDLFQGLQALRKEVVLPNAEGIFSGFYVEHETRGVFRADLDKEASIVLEENGPARATLKMDGWYTNAAGEKFCRYSIRASFFRSRSDVKLEHTFIYTGESHKDKIKSMGLKIAEKTGQRGGVWGEGDQQDDIVRMFTSNVKVVQDSPNRNNIELLVYNSEQAVPVKLAGRSVGALFYGNTTVAIRDAWQQYPWGFEVKEGVMDVQLWPAGERLMDTTFDGFWWHLNEMQKKYMIYTKPNAKEGRLEQYRERTNATGAAKTHEVWLCFASDRASAGPYGARLVREVAHPVIACADPAWSTKTRALDYLLHTPKNATLFGDEERYLDTMLDMVKAKTEAGRWYGWWDWGSYYQLPGMSEPYPFKYSNGENEWNRNKPKSHYSWGQMAWSQYFRTGERKWLRYGQSYTLYSADRAFVHHTDRSVGRIAGYEYHYDNSDIHWMGGYAGKPGGVAFMNPMADKMDYIYQYWLTGDRRAFDVLKMWGELQKDFQGSEYAYKPGLETGGDIRNAGMMLQRVTMLYEATWDPRYLKGAKRLADAYTGIQSEEDLIAAEGDRRTPNGWDVWRFHSASGWAYEGLFLYYKTTGDERMKQTLLTFARRSVNYDSGIGWGYGALRLYAYAYDMTGDEIYLDLSRAMLDDLAEKWVGPYAWVTGQKFTTVTLGRTLGMLANAPDAWKARNLPTDERGRTLRYRYYGHSTNATMPASFACFNKTEDKAWSFRLLFSHGGKWALTRPDGSVAFESGENEFPYNTKWMDVKVPADGQTGTYTLRCIAPSTWSMDPKNRTAELSCDARIIRSSLPVAVKVWASGEGVRPPSQQPASVKGRSLFFKAPEKGVEVGVTPTIVSRPVTAYVDGEKVAGTQGKYPSMLGAFMLKLPDSAAGKMVELQPDRSEGKFYSDVPQGLGAYSGLWFEGAPPWVTANPEEYFVPVIKP